MLLDQLLQVGDIVVTEIPDVTARRLQTLLDGETHRLVSGGQARNCDITNARHRLLLFRTLAFVTRASHINQKR